MRASAAWAPAIALARALVWSGALWLAASCASARAADAPPAPATRAPVLAYDIATDTAAHTACPPAVQAAPADAPARDRGLLWRLSRNGRVSYLFGTLHVGKPAWGQFGPRVSAALRQADTLVLEIDPDAPDLMSALPGAADAPALPPALGARLAQATVRACLPAAALAAMHPVLQVTLLTVLDARWLGMDVAWSQEQLLAAHARARQWSVVGLETAALQAAALVPDTPGQLQATLEQALQQLEDHSGRRVLARLAAAWERGDLAQLADYEHWCECVAGEEERAFLRRLNDDRNAGLADGIAAQHAKGLRVFAAVGALHMTGPQALPGLLAARGFRVERIVFTR